MDIRISNKATGATIGHVTEADLDFLVDQLEEESSKDVDYFINAQTLDMFVSAGASASLVSMLRDALGSSDGIDIVWASR